MLINQYLAGERKSALWGGFVFVGNLVFFVTDVLFLSGIELELVNKCYDSVNTAGKGAEPEICAGSAGVSFGLKTGVIDDDGTDPTEEKDE